MEIRGIFITTKPKNDALLIFKELSQKYQRKIPSNNRESIIICKAYCHDAIEAIKDCFAAEMWGPKQCINKLKYYYSNDEISNVSAIFVDTSELLVKLHSIITEAIPIVDLPSCKQLTELSVSDAVSAINDLGKNSIINAIVCAGLFGKNIADIITISDVEKFYKKLLEELKRELDEKGGRMSECECFLFDKCNAELGYCIQARTKAGIGVAKELVGLVKNAAEAIRKYEERTVNKAEASFGCR